MIGKSVISLRITAWMKWLSNKLKLSKKIRSITSAYIIRTLHKEALNQ